MRWVMRQDGELLRLGQRNDAAPDDVDSATLGVAVTRAPPTAVPTCTADSGEQVAFEA